MSSPALPRTRKPNWRNIKLHRSYSIDQASRLCCVAKGTVRRWIKSGELTAITDKKPYLILGADLREFLQAKRAKGPKLHVHEFYCFSCKEPRGAASGIADYVPLTSTTGNLVALCERCSTLMHKVIAASALQTLEGILDVTVQQAKELLSDTRLPPSNDHLQQKPEHHAKASPEQ